MGSHPTQVNTPHLNPSQTGWYLIYLPRRDGRLSLPRWLVTYRDGLPVRRRSPIQVLTCYGQISLLLDPTQQNPSDTLKSWTQPDPTMDGAEPSCTSLSHNTQEKRWNQERKYNMVAKANVRRSTCHIAATTSDTTLERELAHHTTCT